PPGRDRGFAPRWRSPVDAAHSGSMPRKPALSLEGTPTREQPTAVSNGGDRRGAARRQFCCPSPARAQYPKARSSSFPYLIKHTVMWFAVVTFTQQREQIRHQKQCGRRGEEQASDNRSCQRRILLFAGTANSHRNHADDHGGR